MTQCPYVFANNIEDLDQGTIECSQPLIFKHQRLAHFYEANCLGHHECTLNLHDYFSPVFAPPNCQQSPARLYIQYHCELHDENVERNHYVWFVGAFIAIGTTFVYIFTVLIHQHLQHKYRVRLM